MNLVITPIYVALLSLVFVYLSIRTIGLRRKNKIAIGDGGNLSLQKATRAHANFAEYTPISLLLLSIIELDGYNPILINALGISLLIGRCCHAYGISKTDEDFKYRVSGMTMTFFTIISASVLILAHALFK